MEYKEQTDIQGEAKTSETGSPTMSTLVKKRDALRHRMFLLILEIAFWFGIPAFGAFFLGNYMDGRRGDGHMYLIIFLIIAFVLSWIAILWRIKTLTAKLTEAEKEVREAKTLADKGSPEGAKNNQS